MSVPQIVVCGSIAIDRIMSFSGRYRDFIDPEKLDVLSVSVLVDSMVPANGGTGADIAYNLASLGETPILMGSVGNDANVYLEQLKAKGIDTSAVHISNLPTASFNVMTDSSGNQVGGFYPGAMSDATSLSFLPYKDRDVIFCVSAHDPAGMRRQTDECRDNKLRLIYDPGQQVNNISGEDMRAGLEAAEIVIVNQYELSKMAEKTGFSPEEIKSAVPIFITTLGEHGSEIAGMKYPAAVNILSAKPANISDPTGAGDGFRAGFLYGYLRQWDVKKSGQLGSVTASFVLEHHGPISDISPQAAIERYKQTFNEEITL